MSGHSKWAKIHRQKGAADAQKASLFTKLAKLVSVAAREGKDPEMNFKLRLAIDKARQGNMPKDNIERAIARGAGELGGEIEEAVYEAYGPGGAALLVAVSTDNKNRTLSNVKSVLNKNGGKMVEANAVKWMFEEKGIVRISMDEYQNKDKDEFLLSLIDAGAQDAREEDGGLTVEVAKQDFKKVKDFLDQEKIQTEYASLDWVASDKIKLSDEDSEKLDALIELLEEDDDVDSVYTNVN